MRRSKTLVLIGGLGFVCVVLAGARPASPQEEGKWLPSQAGKWRPLERDAMEDCWDRYDLTAHDRDAVLERLKRLADITREPKVLNPPLGVDAFDSFNILCPPHSDVQKPRSYQPVVGLLRLILVPYFRSGTGQVDMDTDNEGWLTFYLNDILHVFKGERTTHKEVVEDWLNAGGESPEMEDESGLYFFAPKVTGDLQGFPVYDTDVAILVRSRKPLWVPVSQERFLRHAVQRAAEVAKKAKEEEDRVLNEPLPENPELARSIKEAREEGLKSAREIVAQTRAELTEFPGNIRFLPADYVQALTKELASLSPAERAAPAYYSGDWKKTRRPSGLLDAADPAAQPVVSPNPDFFDPSLPKSAVQLIVVLGISSRDKAPAQPERANPAAVRRFEVRNSLDWKKVAALMD